MRVKPIPLFLPGNNAKREVDKDVLDVKKVLHPLPGNSSHEHIASAMLVYRISDNERSYTGLVLGVDIADFLDGHIIHHENTISEKVDRQVAIATDQGGFSKPILLTHQYINIFQNLFDRVTKDPPLLDVFLSQYQTQHQIWTISEEADLREIENKLEQKKELYLVDGHHRTAALKKLFKNKVGQINFGMCALFDIEQLKILPFHRTIKVEPSFNPTSFLESIQKFGSLEIIKNARLPDAKHQMIWMIGSHIYKFSWKEEIIRNHSGAEVLDVNLLTNLILKKTLNFSDENLVSNVEYIEGNTAAKSIQSRILDSGNVAVLLFPISMQNLIDITNTGQILPPKSTWFLPRMANGIVTTKFAN